MDPGGLTDLDAAWRVEGLAARHRAVRAAAERAQVRLAEGPRVLSVRTLPIMTFAYPTRFALSSAALSPAPFVILTHRAVLVQFLERGEIRTLLFNPTDELASRATPFFAALVKQVGDYVAFQLVSRQFPPLLDQLAELGLAPGDVDYVAYPNLQHQDLRPVLGGESPRFDRARLLVSQAEWEALGDLHPLQRAWYLADGCEGVAAERVQLLEGSRELGDGVALLAAPGHTPGNQTLFFNTPDGVWAVSANGTCADSWSPLESQIRGVASACRRQGVSVLLDANSPHSGGDHYTAMVLERTLAGRMKRAPGFSQIFPVSEVTPSKVAPGLSPTIEHAALRYGEVISPRAGEQAAGAGEQAASAG